MMVTGYTLSSLLLFVNVLQQSFSAILDEQCTLDDDCQVPNSGCVRQFSECLFGACTCKSGYLASGDSLCQKTRSNLQSCESDNEICIDGTTCRADAEGNKVCACPDNRIFNVYIRQCIHNSKVQLDAMCATYEECYNWATDKDAMKCSPEWGTLSPKYCRCKDGYTAQKYGCVKAKLREECDLSRGCLTVTNGDSSIQSTICRGNVCICPATATDQRALVDGVIENVCIESFNGEKKDDGKICSASKECSSKACMLCKGEGKKRCVNIETSNASKMANHVVSVSIAVIFLHVFMF